MLVRDADLDGVPSRAWYSPCEAYRYGLERRWGAGPVLLYVMLNPSKATEARNDPTIERCQRRAKALGFGTMRIANLFAWRATDPRDLRRSKQPQGAENDKFLTDWSHEADMTLAAWGTHGAWRNAGPRAAALITGELHHLGVTKHGHPRHPLYVSYEAQPQKWGPSERANYAQIVGNGSRV